MILLNVLPDDTVQLVRHFCDAFVACDLFAWCLGAAVGAAGVRAFEGAFFHGEGHCPALRYLMPHSRGVEFCAPPHDATHEHVQSSRVFGLCLQLAMW